MTFIDPSRLTTWSPGVIGGIPVRSTIFTTISAATYGNGATDSASAVQAAINACPAGQVVLLSEGTFKWLSTIQLNKGITLRGAGRGRTVVTGGVRQIQMGPSGPPQNAIYAVFTHHTLLTVDAAKGGSSITVADATGYVAGDLALISMRDDSTIKPPPNVGGDFLLWVEPGGQRHSCGQIVHIASVVGNVITIDENILHCDFTTARAAVLGKAPSVVVNAGIEGIRFQHPSEAIIASFCEQSWIKDCETDTSNGPTSFWCSNRCEVRETYFHHAQGYSQGGASYGLTLDAYTSNTLVEDNIMFFFNKPFLFRASGGGNVVAYNYCDGAQDSASPTWMEPDIDSHMVFSHFELVEGNWCGMIGLLNTWGGVGNITFLRNRSLGQHVQPQLKPVQWGNQAAIVLNAGAGNCNMAGNVLGMPGLASTAGPYLGTPAYYWNIAENDPVNPFITAGGYIGSQYIAMYRLGNGSMPGAFSSFDVNENPYPDVPLVEPTSFISGNYDYVTNTVVWDSADHSLPNSYYLSGTPSFFGPLPWPWIDPAGTTKVHVLPAKQRFDALTTNSFFFGSGSSS